MTNLEPRATDGEIEELKALGWSRQWNPDRNKWQALKDGERYHLYADKASEVWDLLVNFLPVPSRLNN